MQKEAAQYWYANWFDTPYYHILYKDRDHEEAGDFMNHLTQFLKLTVSSEILDLACGRGRHSIYLNSLGYNVTGVDLSSSSIRYARKFENDRLRFIEHDMCAPIGSKFDAIFNLFTSFGYFEDEADNLRTIKAIKSSLKPGGFGVIDFLNVDYAFENLVPSEVKTIDGIHFNIKRYVESKNIIKEIEFEHLGREFHYREKVRALELQDFLIYFNQAGARLLNCFGDYKMRAFQKNSSERLILVFS